MAKKKPMKRPAKKARKKPRKKGTPRTKATYPERQDLRRGITPGEVPFESIVRILEAGRSAPSAANLQPWVFLVIREERMREEVARLGERPWYLHVGQFLRKRVYREILKPRRWKKRWQRWKEKSRRDRL